MFHAFRLLLTASFHRNFGLPLRRFTAIFISATARMFSVSCLILKRPNLDNYTRHFVPFPMSTFALCSVHRTSVIKRPTVDYCVILKNVRCTEHNANRVKGQADLCQFTKQCTCTNTVRYTDEMVRDVIIRGLYDQDTQRDVLGMQEQDMQLDALLKLLEAKEIGKKTQASILGETGASISRYKRYKNPSRADDQNKPGKCH